MKVLLLAIALLPSVARSQEPARTRVWASGGLGGGGNSVTGGIAALLQLSVMKQPHQFSLRGIALVDPFPSGSFDAVGDVGVLYGRATTGRVGHASISAGVAYASGDFCTGDPFSDCETTSTLGVPIVAEAALRPLPVLGLGVQAFLTITGKASFGGLILLLQLGWLP